MTEDVSIPILFGYFEEFLGRNTLLLLSDRAGFSQFAKHIEATAPESQHVTGGNILRLRNGGQTLDLRFVWAKAGSTASLAANDRSIEWSIGREAKSELVERLEALTQVVGPAHAYLETEGDIQIMASIGEYPDDILRRSRV